MMNQFIKHNLLLPLLILPILISNGARTVTQADATYAPYQVVNGGFETGDQTGWTRYGLWKGESGMQAFDTSLVTSGTYFSSYPYNKTGTYCMGITSASVTWSQSEERMGYLRSSNFTLGGTGWISFKLGGGKNTEFAYMSVRKTSDNTEVARFGNRFFNNTSRATTVYGSSISNAEAFLFPYYFNLSTVTTLGTGLYILLCDTAGYNWSILSADAFVTYYATAPSPGTDDLATNIVPSILHVGNGGQTYLTQLNGSLSEWTNVDNIWKTDSGYCRSDNGGDAALGSLRSSAFTITPTYDHIRMGWGGRLMADKQIFISVKEVGSNIEMLRILRRADKSSYSDGARQNAMIDLTFLNGTGKEYYLEISDNTTDGWGLNTADSVRFITDSDWSAVVTPYPGDQVTYLWSGASDSYHTTGMADAFPGTTLTSTQEATSYGTDFLNDTASYCSTLGGATMATDGKWTALANAYATLSSTAKDYFVNAGTTDTSIVQARDRYVFLIGKYTALHDNNFMTSSTGTVYHATVNGGATLENPGNMSGVLIIIIGVTLLAAVSYVSIRKKRNQN